MMVRDGRRSEHHLGPCSPVVHRSVLHGSIATPIQYQRRERPVTTLEASERLAGAREDRRKRWRRLHREQWNERQRLYRLENRERVNARKRAWRAARRAMGLPA